MLAAGSSWASAYLVDLARALPVGLTHIETHTASPATVAGAGHLLQMGGVSVIARCVTAGAKVSALVLGSSPCIFGLYIYQLLGCGWFQPKSGCGLVST